MSIYFILQPLLTVAYLNIYPGIITLEGEKGLAPLSPITIHKTVSNKSICVIKLSVSYKRLNLVFRILCHNCTRYLKQ